MQDVIYHMAAVKLFKSSYIGSKRLTGINVVIHDCVTASGHNELDAVTCQLKALLHQLQAWTNVFIQGPASILFAAQQCPG